MTNLSSTNWIPGWEYLVQKPFARDITPDKPTTAPLTNLIGYFFGKVSRALAGGATGPEVFTFLLRLLSNRFDRTVTRGTATQSCIISAFLTGPHFAVFSREFRGVVSPVPRILDQCHHFPVGEKSPEGSLAASNGLCARPKGAGGTVSAVCLTRAVILQIFNGYTVRWI